MRLNETLEPVVHTYMINTFTPWLTNLQVTQCGERWLAIRGIGSANPSSDRDLFF